MKDMPTTILPYTPIEDDEESKDAKACVRALMKKMSSIDRVTWLLSARAALEHIDDKATYLIVLSGAIEAEYQRLCSAMPEISDFSMKEGTDDPASTV